MPIKISHTSKPLGSLFIYLFIYLFFIANSRGNRAPPGFQGLVKIEVLFGWETKYEESNKRPPRHSQVKKSLYYYGLVKLTI